MASMKRHKAEGGYPRGEETRVRIIRIAMGLFGEKGFDGVTTREIATMADVPAPSLQYYFENKEGLYLACIEHNHAAALEAIGPVLQRAEDLVEAGAEIDQLIGAYCDVLDNLADFLFGSPDAASRALFVARLRMSSELALVKAKLKQTPGKRIQDCCAAILARIVSDDTTEEERKLIATTINGQLFIVHVAREHLKDLVGWDEITPARVVSLKRIVRRQVASVLNSYREP